MATRNADTFRAAHRAFNKRDFDAVVKAMRDDFTYHDHARDQTFKGPDGFREFMEGWVSAFSNAEVSKPRYIDAGEVIVAEFIGRGVNDGALGSLPQTGREMSLPFCEILHFDEQGRIASGDVYYDQLTLMAQLGHIRLPEKVTVG